MSPSESDLRAALHHGEGDGPSADAVIAGARELRVRRRSRLLSTAAVVVVVGGAGFGIAQLAGDNSGRASTSGAAATERRAGPVSPPVRDSDAAAAKAPSAAVGCPATFPHYLLPGGGSPGQFGSGGPLFSKPVASVVVCGYIANGRPRRTVLTGQDASALASSLDAASKVPSAKGSCPILASNVRHEVAMIGVAADGSTARTVTATFGPGGQCGAQVTNGTAVRYGWVPPPAIQQFVRSLPKASAAPSGAEQGSPIHT